MERRLYRFGRAGRVTGDPRLCPLPWEVVAARSASAPYRGKRQECRFPEWSRRSATLPLRPQQVATLPWFRAGGGLLFAARSRHEKPYPPMSKINFLALVRVSWHNYTPFPRPKQAGILKIEVLRAGARHSQWRAIFIGSRQARTLTLRSQQAATLPQSRW